MGLQKIYREDDIILKEKELNKFMYTILSGSVALYINYQAGDEYLLGVCGRGKTFGEMGLLCHEPSMYTAVAVEDVKVAIFSEYEMDAFIKGYPNQAIGLMRNIARINKLLNANLRMAVEENMQSEKLIQIAKEYKKQDVAPADTAVVSEEELKAMEADSLTTSESVDESSVEDITEERNTNLKWHSNNRRARE